MTVINLQGLSRIRNQFVVVLCVNIVTLSHGLSAGWLSTYLEIFQTEKSPLVTGKISILDVSWIGAFLSVGGIFGNIICGILTKIAGFKVTMMFIASCHVVFWLLILFAKYTYHLILSRFVIGFSGGGMYACILLFTAEISDNNVRGIFGGLFTVIYNLGTLLVFSSGIYTNYVTLGYIALSLPITFCILLLILPHSPRTLIQIDKLEEAEKSLKFYKNYQLTQNDQFKAEFEKIKDSVNNSNENESDKLKFVEIFKLDHLKKFLICFIFLSFNSYCGYFPMISYTSNVFKVSGTDINHHIASTCVAFVQLIGSLIAIYLVDNIGRKKLLLISTSGSSIGSIITGIFSYLSDSGTDLTYFNFIPIISVSFVIFISSIGIMPVPFVVLAEFLPGKIRKIGFTIAMLSFSINTIIILKLFPILLDSIKLYGCMCIFTGYSIFSFIFIIAFIPETKGKDLYSSNDSTDKTVEITRL